METALAKIEKAKTLLAEARRVQEVKDILDAAKAAKVYAQQKQLSDETRFYCHEIYTRAEIKLGQMLAKLEKNKGSQGNLKGSDKSGGRPVRPPDNSAPTLKELGLTKDQSSVAQMLAALPEGEQEKIIQGTKTIADVKRERRREARVEKVKEISKGNKALKVRKTYPVILIDPPWPYDFSRSENRNIENQYPTMSMEELEKMQEPLAQLAAPDSVMFMWATSPKLMEAVTLLNLYGFEYVTNAVWVKDKIGMGYYFRQAHELLLVGKRGKLPAPNSKNRVSSVVEAPRAQRKARVRLRDY